MPLSRKVVWNEGMFLGPHHFQQWDRYHQGLLNFRLSSLVSHEWGITELKINVESLKNGECEIEVCTSVLPDGLAFSFPETDQTPKSRTIEDKFVTESGTVDVYLAVPVEHAGGMNCNLNNGKLDTETRYEGEFDSVVDENTGKNSKEVLFAKKNLRIIFSGEPESLSNHSWIKVVELQRTAANTFQLNESYIPPCLNISASHSLVSKVSGLLNSLIDKRRTLSGEIGQRTSQLIDFGPHNIAQFWFLHSINSFLPVLSHYSKVESVHPEQLFCALSQLAGELTTFSASVQLEDLPEYQHTNLSHTFAELYSKIQVLLDTVIPENWIDIPLQKENGLWMGRLLEFDDKLIDSAEFYLGISADLPESQLIEDFPKFIKIGARDDIDDLKKHALPGVPVNQTPTPPSPLPIKMGFQYFRLDTHGDFWGRIRSSKNIAMDIPDSFPNLKIEFMALKK